MTKRTLTFIAATLALTTAWAQDEVTLTYWQYDFESKVDAIDTLIERFEEANPGVTVEQQTFPYDAFQQQVAAAVPAGQGPDVVNLFYGWLPAWADAGYLIPLPGAQFEAATIEEAFIPTVQAARYEGDYWGLPTAVRNLALFYNQDLLDEAGIEPPTTWDAFIAAAKALTVGEDGRFSQIGYGVAPDGQDHNLVREVLVRQFGGTPYSENNREVSYNSAAGKEAFDFYTGWVTDEQIGVPDFVPGGASGSSAGYRTGFLAGRIAMIIDGSFAIDTFREEAGFNWGVAELPVREEGGTRANFSSFWLHGLTPLAEENPETLEAASAFLQFITSEEAMQLWLEEVGELPARALLAEDAALAEDPVYGPFIRALPYSSATFFVNEDEQRRIMLDAINRVWLEDAEPATSLDRAAEEEQALLNSFYGD